MNYKVLISGLGSIGKRHLKNLISLGIRDVIIHRRKNEPLEGFEDLRVITNITQNEIEGCNVGIICNPSSLHIKTAYSMIEAGIKNLFIEKPLSSNLSDINNFLEIIQKNNITTFVGYDLRFDPGLLKVKDLLKSNIIGDIISIQASVGQYLPDWRPHEDYSKGTSAKKETGGGVILDLIHEIDYVTWLLGPVEYIASINDKLSSLNIETEDTAVIILKFQNQAIGTIHLDYVQRKLSRNCKIVGNDGIIIWDYVNKTIDLIDKKGEQSQVFEYKNFERNDRFINEMKHFLNTISNKEKPLSDIFNAYITLKIALAAKESSETKSFIKI